MKALIICGRLWQKQDLGLKSSFVHFSLELINNNFWLKCCKNYYSIFMGSRDMNFIMLFYSEVQFREKRLQSLLIYKKKSLAVHVYSTLMFLELLRQNVQMRSFLSSRMH